MIVPNTRLATILDQDEDCLQRELGPHCLRHSYATQLIEEGWDALFVQRQLGHAWASTTAIYTGVSGEYQNRMLRDVLDRRLAGTTPEEG